MIVSKNSGGSSTAAAKCSSLGRRRDDLQLIVCDKIGSDLSSSDSSDDRLVADANGVLPPADPNSAAARSSSSVASSSSSQSAPVGTIDGTYDFTGTVTSGPCKANGVHQFVVTTTGADPNRQIRLALGEGAFTGSLRPDNSFETTAPPRNTDTNSDTLVGSFDVTQTPVTMTGDESVTGKNVDGTDTSCTFHITGHKV